MSLTLASIQTFGELSDQHLPSLGFNTRRTYQTHHTRLLDGYGPVCDSETCEPCLQAPVFECSCACARCARSRITIEAHRNMPVTPDTCDSNTVRDLAEVARRLAIKRGIVENRTRAQRGLAPKRATGKNAAETCVAAMRNMFGAVKKADRGGKNPALKVK